METGVLGEGNLRVHSALVYEVEYEFGRFTSRNLINVDSNGYIDSLQKSEVCNCRFNLCQRIQISIEKTIWTCLTLKFNKSKTEDLSKQIEVFIYLVPMDSTIIFKNFEDNLI